MGEMKCSILAMLSLKRRLIIQEEMLGSWLDIRLEAQERSQGWREKLVLVLTPLTSALIFYSVFHLFWVVSLEDSYVK